MANNIHISYDLAQPATYEPIIEKIKTLGKWAKIELSFWYVNTDSTAVEVKEALRPLLKNGDKLYVLDASNNSAAWIGVSKEVSTFIRDKWLV